MSVKEQTKIAEEDILALNEIRTAYARITAQLGQLNVRKLILEREIKGVDADALNLNQEYLGTLDKENTLIMTLNEKYGEGSLDLESGTFTPKQ